MYAASHLQPHTVAIGVVGEPTAPARRSGGGVSRKALRSWARSQSARSARCQSSPRWIPSLNRTLRTLYPTFGHGDLSVWFACIKVTDTSEKQTAPSSSAMAAHAAAWAGWLQPCAAAKRYRRATELNDWTPPGHSRPNPDSRKPNFPAVAAGANRILDSGLSASRRAVWRANGGNIGRGGSGMVSR